MDKFDFLFGENFTCYNCDDEILEGEYLCKDCYSKINFIAHACKRCGEQVNEYSSYCDKCKERKNFCFEKCISVANLQGVARSLVYKLKFGGKRYIAYLFAHFIWEKLRQEKIDIDYLCYVPVSLKRLKERGYNQARGIALHLSKISNIPVKENLFLKIKDTADQTTLTREDRFKNMSGAFFALEDKDIKGKTIAIIDDVITTTATVSELSKLLKRRGAGKVYALSFCHG